MFWLWSNIFQVIGVSAICQIVVVKELHMHFLIKCWICLVL
jgi:hypothetical protein